MNNPIFEQILKERKGHYCHCVEVSNIYDLENIVEMVCTEYLEHGEKAIIEFLESLNVYHIEDEDLTEQENEIIEESVHNFSFTDYVKDTI